MSRTEWNFSDLKPAHSSTIYLQFFETIIQQELIKECPAMSRLPVV